MFNESLGDANEPNPIRISAVSEDKDAKIRELEAENEMLRADFNAMKNISQQISSRLLENREKFKKRWMEAISTKRDLATVTARENALREAVAGLLQRWREEVIRTSDFDGEILDWTTHYCAEELDAILKGAGND